MLAEFVANNMPLIGSVTRIRLVPSMYDLTRPSTNCTIFGSALRNVWVEDRGLSAAQHGFDVLLVGKKGADSVVEARQPLRAADRLGRIPSGF